MSYMREEITPTSDSYPYVTGMGFRNRSHLIYDEFQKDDAKNITKDGQVVFIKIDFVRSFFLHVMPDIKHKVNIVSHNGALGIDLCYLQYLDNRKVINWYAQNADIKHHKLISIPLGLANKRWAHGDVYLLEGVIQEPAEKKHLVYLNFDVGTNSGKRTVVHNVFSDKEYVYKAPRKSFEEYLRDLKASKFSLSPQGRGADCHRIWESIAVGTIPIVKDCQNISFYSDMPILVIKDWEDVSEEFLQDEYEKIATGERNSSKLFMDYWIEKIGLTT